MPVKLIVISLCLMVVLVLASLEAMGFAEAGLLSLGSVVLVIVLLIRFVRAASSQKRREMWSALMLLLVFLGSMAMASFLETKQVEASMDRGDRILAALTSYHGRVGQYPEQLEQLAPTDLAELPSSAMAVVRSFGFEYSREGDSGFVLSFATPMWQGFLRRADGPWIPYD